MADADMSEPPTKKQKTATLPPIVDFGELVKDPTNLVLRVGKLDHSVLVRLHSVFLKFASPVFTTMLEGPFTEGQQQYTTDHPLCLEDDDSETFVEYCEIIYMVKSGDAAVPIERLPDIAVLVDKYGSGDRLRHVFTARLSPLLRNDLTRSAKTISEQGVDIPDLLFMAYVVRDEDLFWRASQEVAAHMNLGDLKHKGHSRLTQIIPDAVFTQLERLRDLENALLDRYYAIKVYDAFAQYNLTINNLLAFPCVGGQKWVAQYEFLLQAAREGSATFASSNRPPAKAWRSLEAAGRYMMPNICPDRKACDRCLTVRKIRFESAFEFNIDNFHGLCLKCVRDGTELHLEPPCKHL